jgi:hypothetical protein
VSDSDHLGAIADVRIAAWLATERVPFALEAGAVRPAAGGQWSTVVIAGRR